MACRASACFTCDASDPLLRRTDSRRRSGRPDVRHRSRQARTPRCGARTRRSPRKEDPDLRWRPLQFHQHPLPAGEFPFLQSALREVSAGSLHARRLHCSGREAPHSLSRKDAGPTFLRPLGARYFGDARGGMPTSQRNDFLGYEDSRGDARVHVLSCAREPRSSTHQPWSSQPEVCRFPRLARPRSATIWRGSSGSRFESRVRDSYPWCSMQTIVLITAISPAFRWR